MTLIEMAIAFVIEHPAVTAAVIGPRTMEHLESQLRGAQVTLTADVLDAIDAIVPPGETLDVGDHHQVLSGLDPASRRRSVGVA
jgi:aryl-alcohol dehydrogenase-like predicted oxidoreductase